METPIFLGIDEIIRLHDLQLDHFGGLEGLRDRGLLESAVAMPQAGFGEHFVHADIYEMAELELSQSDAYDLVIATAEGRADKATIATAFRAHSRP